MAISVSGEQLRMGVRGFGTCVEQAVGNRIEDRLLVTGDPLGDSGEGRELAALGIGDPSA